MRKARLKIFLGALVLSITLMSILAWSSQNVLAESSPRNDLQISPLHPTFPFLDEDGVNVLDSGKPLSTIKTCGACHDAEFIHEHSFHADIGLTAFTEPGEVPNGRPWDTSPGYFGKWNPLTYRYLSPLGDERIDLSTSEWLQILGARHAGGGPGVYSREGEVLTDLEVTQDDPETNTIDPVSGELVPWNWSGSGMVEMNCFLCHTPSPNNEARIQALADGEFRWASTATLLGSGIVNQQGSEYQWNADAFDADGDLSKEFVAIQDPTNDNCGQCHGLVHDDLEDPIITTGCLPDRWMTVTSGQIISPQRLSDSGLNLADKEDLTRTWDIHAERLLLCTDCHYSLNNPVYYQETDETSPEHLLFDPRRLEIGEYLYQPLHQFARGQSAESTVAPELKDTMRRCESCHSIEPTHDWLPYKERHVAALSCESCHIPKMYSPTVQQFDWTVLYPDDEPGKICRGVEGEHATADTLITGFEPVLLMRENVDGNRQLSPYNMVTSWYWVYGEPPRPVRLDDLKAAWFDGNDYHPEVLRVFDVDDNGTLDASELVIDNAEKESLIADRLAGLGLESPRIVGEIQPYSINHTVTNEEWVTKDCQTCHSEESKITQPFRLAAYIPGGVLPEFVQDSNTDFAGELFTNDAGELFYEPGSGAGDLYVLGRDNVAAVDLIGGLIFLGVLAGIFVHGGLRVLSALRRPHKEHETKEVYMYTIYERLWHWLQTFVIMLLLFTGLIIHKPDTFGIFSFRYVVLVHNVMAGILAINAGLALFYHLASGEIKQYIPRPQGFFDMAITQATYYLRGIFKGEEHPYEKTPQKKLNPLQQATYFGLLNVLLPLIGITGILMWGAQRWPLITATIRGLTYIAPIHTLIAWLFASFIVMHVYLTTTGYKPMTAIKAMMMGWEEVEVSSEIMGDQDIEDTAEAQETEDPEILPQDIQVSEGESNDNEASQTEYESGTDEDSDSKEASS
jgi:thiosulfate reductase cytochrome b subunit